MLEEETAKGESGNRAIGRSPAEPTLLLLLRCRVIFLLHFAEERFEGFDYGLSTCLSRPMEALTDVIVIPRTALHKRSMQLLGEGFSLRNGNLPAS